MHEENLVILKDLLVEMLSKDYHVISYKDLMDLEGRIVALNERNRHRQRYQH